MKILMLCSPQGIQKALSHKINNLVGQQDNIIERRNNIEIQINKQNNLIIFYKNVLDDVIKIEDEMNERISKFLI